MDLREPAARSALCFLKGAVTVAMFLAMLAFGATPAICAGGSKATPEVACAQIRDAVRKVATAERNQALALHLMADGKPTPMVQTRLTELQEQIGDLREILHHARNAASRHNSDISDCISMGFQSLTDAESVSRQIQDIVMSDGGLLGLPPQIKSDERGAEKLPEPPLPRAPSHAE
jgi:hypothetical protein